MRRAQPQSRCSGSDVMFKGRVGLMFSWKRVTVELRAKSVAMSLSGSSSSSSDAVTGSAGMLKQTCLR